MEEQQGGLLHKGLSFYRKLIETMNLRELPNVLHKWAFNLKAEFLETFQDWRVKVNDLPMTNFKLGIYHFNQGNFGDAILRFRIALFFNYTLNPAYYYLGRCYYQRLQFDKAGHYFNLYKNSGDKSLEAANTFCLNVLEQKMDKVLDIPPDIICVNFNQIAKDYDANFIEGRINIPQDALFVMVNEHLQAHAKPYGNTVVDLGCGTGYIGQLLRNARLVSNLIGVDISPAMIQLSGKRVSDKIAVYSRLENTSMQDFIASCRDNQHEKCDVVIASNLISYEPDINSFFLNVKDIMLPNAILALSFKTTVDAQNEVEFDRYLECFFFAPNYVEESAKKYGFNLLQAKDVKFVGEVDGKVMIFNL